jgi:hypothetical protein
MPYAPVFPFIFPSERKGNTTLQHWYAEGGEETEEPSLGTHPLFLFHRPLKSAYQFYPQQHSNPWPPKVRGPAVVDSHDPQVRLTGILAGRPAVS